VSDRPFPLCTRGNVYNDFRAIFTSTTGSPARLFYTDPANRIMGDPSPQCLSWVEKYRPVHIQDVVGQGSAIKEMMDWASAWVGQREVKKGLILDGEPGTGKTTAALALARYMGWEPLELNASDSRNQEAIRTMATRGSQSASITDGYFDGTGDRPAHKLIILDEADSLYEGSASEDGEDLSDRGGKRAIVELIKASMHPVILIVNDLYSLTKGSGASLNFMCAKVKFRKLQSRTVLNRLKDICEREGIANDGKVLESLAERSSGDLRAGIGDLQIISSGKKFIGIGDLDVIGDRDTKDNIFNVLWGIFSAQSVEAAKRSMQQIDEDPQTLLLWVSQNVPSAFPGPTNLDAGMGLISRSDVYLGRVRRRQNYRLWRYASDMMASVHTAGKGRPPVRGQFAFPTYLREMSRTKDSRAQLKEIAQKLGSHTHMSVRDMKSGGLGWISALLREDRELAAYLVADTGLTKENLEFLLGPEKKKKEYQMIMDEAQTLLKGRAAPKGPETGLSLFSVRTEDEDEESSNDESGEGIKEDFTGKNDQDKKDDKKSPQMSLFDF